MDPANDRNSVRGSPPSPGEVVEYLVHNEPLKYVAEISAHVDAYTSELKRDSRVMESFDTALEKEKGMRKSIDELMKECRGLHSIISKRVKEARSVVDVRSRDLLLTLSGLHATPLTTSPTSPRTSPSLARMITRVHETQTTQAAFLNELEMDRDRVKAALDKLSNRRKSLMDIFSAAPSVQGDSCLGSTPHEFVRHLRYPLDASLRGKCQQLTQEFVAGVEKIVKNGETIRELALVLERNRDLNPAVPPDTDAFPTLAEELSAWRIRYGGKENTLQQNFPPTTAKRILRVLYSETLDVWTDLTNLKRFYFAHPLIPSWYWTPPFPVILVILSIILVTVAYLARSPASCDRFANPRTISASPSSIRDLLLGGEENVPDRRVHNLIPKRV